ncbi:MAG TPA: carbohydrate ABC transporter permease [Kiritimatiellia bacterium]|nr:carbohydrate ABC transporter permease [Kiritimatiellia bacterium]
MAVLLPVERKTMKARVFLALIYAVLSLGGITMVWPFLVMLASSLTGPYDYYRHAPVVRAMWDRNDRFTRYLATCFPRFPSTVYPDAPTHWGSWTTVAREGVACRAWAAEQLKGLADPVTAERWRRMAEDYAAFNRTYEIANTVCHFDPRDVAGFVRRHYEERVRDEDPQAYNRMSPKARRQAALARLNAEWPVRYTSFFGIRMMAQQRAPLHHAGWDEPIGDAKMAVYQTFKAMYREQAAARGVPMSRTRPFESLPLWSAYLRRALPEAADKWDGFFPLPADAPDTVRRVWERFIREAYPRRLLRVRVTPERERAYRAYVRSVCRTPEAYAQLTGRSLPPPDPSDTSEAAAFSGLPLPAYENSTLWRNFIPSVPLAELSVRSAEQAWQAFLLERYGSTEGVREAYGLPHARIEAARLPLREALAVTFARRGGRDFLDSMLANYRLVGEYLFLRGQAFGNTLLLVVLSILATLTVNPLAAYALSRFGLRRAENILLFLLATMAFPAAVTAIPGFLLIRDLGLLNTFAALVLPTLASGMSIFILKGFFDGLPRELYEAAAIDGAKEWQILLRITLPMTTPILAVNALTAFVHAYNSWEWALLVCQKPSRWTLAVWMYQMSQQLSDQPWAVMAGFVLVSLPTALVFFACQKVILRGIVLPSMK